MDKLLPPDKSFVGTWPTRRYAPVGRCIYCGTTEGKLTDEHIVPFGLLPKGMDWFLPKSTCENCAKITTKFEGSVQQGMLGPLRHKLGLKSRRKRPATHNVTFNYKEDGRIEEREISLNDFPPICIGFRWPPPGILRHVAPTSVFEGELVVRQDEAAVRKLIRDGESFKMGRVFTLDFARMLAKIAHAFAIAERGIASFEPILPDLILGKTDAAPYLIGGDASDTPEEYEAPLHYLGHLYAEISGTMYLLISIRLFARLGMPRYHIIVGRSTENPSLIKQTSQARAITFPAP